MPVVGYTLSFTTHSLTLQATILHTHYYTKTTQFESKTLSLELLLSVMEHSGPAFRTVDKFIVAVTNYLCVSVLKNCTSANTVVVGLSLRIFVLLSQSFKEHLKSEIEVFITSIFLRILESGNSTYDHKKLVLDVVCTICASPHTLAEIFLNYDCDSSAIDLYKRIVNALGKVAIGRGPTVGGESHHTAVQLKEECHLRSAGLEGLVNILVSMLTSISVEGEVGGVAVTRQVGGTVPHPSRAQQSLADSEAALAALNGSDEAGFYGNGSHHGDDSGSSSSGTQQQQQQQQQQQGSSNATLVHEYDRKKKLEAELANGFIRFNLSPAKGLLFLEGKGLLEHTPAGVAAFLHAYADKLDKAAIGEYLGKEKEYKGGFCIKVLALSL
jgi:brefeldin A-inhibited guanine nucleotide-exchange protein